MLDKLPIEKLAQQLAEVNQINKELKEQLAQIQDTQQPEEKIIIREDKELSKNYQKLAKELMAVKKQNQQERYFFITALAIGLSIMSGLLIKLKRFKKRIT